MVTVIKAVTLFPTPSAGAKHTPNLAMFHEYLDKDSTKDEKSMKEMVSSIAKTLHSAGEGKAAPRRLTRLISNCLLQKSLEQKTSILPGMVLAILRFKQTSPFRTKQGKFVFRCGWLVATNYCPDQMSPRDIPCLTKQRNATGQYIGKNLIKIMTVKDLRYTDLDKGRMADFKFCMCNMFLVTDSSDDTTISIIKSQVREYQNKHPDGELVDLLGEKLTPTKQSRKRKVLAENKK